MHLSLPQTVAVINLQGSTDLLIAQAECQNVHISNTANASNGDVRGVAKLKKVIIMKENQNGGERRV